jgi:hypothetical protein
MTARPAHCVLMASLLYFGVPSASARAQALGLPRDEVDARIRGFGIKLRHFQSVVRKRLDEVRPEGKEESDRDRKQRQEAVVAQAKDDLEKAKMAAEVAEVAIQEYEKGTLLQDLAAAHDEIALAEHDVRSAEDRSAELQVLIKKLKGKLPENDPRTALFDWEQSNRVVAAELSIKKEKLGLEQATTRKMVLLDLVKPKRQKELRNDLERARSEILARKAAFALAKDTLDRVNREIDHPPSLTDEERKAVGQLDQALQVWKKVLASRREFRGGVPEKRAAFSGVLAELDDAMESAAQAWDDAQEIRLEAMDLEFEARLRRASATKPPG